MAAVPHPVDPCDGRPVCRDQSINEFSDKRKRRQRRVKPKQPALSATVRHCPKNGLGSAINVSAAIDIVDGLLEIALVDLWQLSTDLLPRYKFNLFADSLVPSFDASAAKCALAVKDH